MSLETLKSKLNKPSFLEELPSHTENSKVLLCAHGLNQKPEALKYLLKDLNDEGFRCFLFHLPGHFGNENYRSLSAESYLEAHKKAYDYLKKKYGDEIFFVGYSFGGLIGVHHFEECPFEKMVLIAPALKLHGYTSLIKPFLPHINRLASISLRNPEFEARYRYHEMGVPAEIYTSFFTIYSQNKFKDKSLAKNSEALVLVHPRDELVSFWKLKRWVLKKTKWKFKSLDNRKAPFRRYNHLCFDPTTLGEESYKVFLEEIVNFL